MVDVIGRIMTLKDVYSLILRTCEYSSPSLSTGEMLQDPQWMPETSDSSESYMYSFLLFVQTFSLKGSTSSLFCGVSEFPASLLLHFGAIIKKSKGDLNTTLI